jgi:hypothetical protein
LLEVGRIKNPRLKSVSKGALIAANQAIDALVINLAQRASSNGSMLDIKPRPDARPPRAPKQNHNDEVSQQMLAQLSVMEGLLKRVNNLERGQEFLVVKLI